MEKAVPCFPLFEAEVDGFVDRFGGERDR